MTPAHGSLLHEFQKVVELSEAIQIQNNLLATNANNIEMKTTELKSVLTSWRERLPNTSDTMEIWSDLVSWRQHVFSLINKAYIPIISVLQQNQSQNSAANSFAYKGFHETAWIINRFASVARKHTMTDVCINALSKIYTLPNIEIQEAFFKLREQAKCHLLNPSEYVTGLDVINNTNLMYFTPFQKSEFFMLKGRFLANLNLISEAEEALSHAAQMETNLPRAWAAWGQFNDKQFRDQPKETKYGAQAITCYLNAASLFNSDRSRRYLARVLWLLSQDDESESIGKAYEAFKPDQPQHTPTWYWVSFIPQLLSSLSHKEAKYSRQILMSIGKNYPQVCFSFSFLSEADHLGVTLPSSIDKGRVDDCQEATSVQECPW